LTPRRVRFTPTARRHVHREELWWVANRIHLEVFVDEFEQALKVLALLPGAGSLYPQAGVRGLRRIYVPKVACHLYYTFDDEQVIVHALWGARRKRGPRLRTKDPGDG
jgi:plasmid stabilization system protein ParE